MTGLANICFKYSVKIKTRSYFGVVSDRNIVYFDCSHCALLNEMVRRKMQ
jgi:hypothetical protein